MTKKYNELKDDDYVNNSDNIDGEEVNYKTAESEAEAQEFRDLDDEEILFIQTCLELADEIIKSFSKNNSINNYDLELLDNIIDQWNADNTNFGVTENEFVNSIGAAFGQKLTEQYNMIWTMLTDSYGTDYAITIPEIKLTNFPLSSVLKAVEDRRVGSLISISLLTKKQIEELRADNK